MTAIGFMPNGFAQSTAGEYTSNMFWVVGLALIASWFVAVVFTPYLGVKILPDIAKVEGGHAAIYDTPRYNRFRHTLSRVIARKWIVAASVVAIFTLAVLGMGLVKNSFSRRPTAPRCWWKCRCRMAHRLSKPAPPPRKSKRGCANSLKPASSPPTLAGFAALLSGDGP